MKKNIFVLGFVFCLFLFGNLPSDAAYCNSPCPNPCSSSRTICEGANCTTYCNSSVYSTNYYTYPGVSFSYSTPNVTFSVSNEVYGIHNYSGIYPRRIVVTNGFRPVYYHKKPPRPVIKPMPKPPVVHKPPHNASHKGPHKPGGKPQRR